MTHVLNNVDQSLADWSDKLCVPRFRAGQIRSWLFQRRATDWLQMADLPKSLRQELAHDLQLWTTEVVRHTQADDGTEKLLLKLIDGGQVECVLLRDRVRRTICISRTRSTR